MEKSSQQSLLCCRACLMSDCRLYDIHEYEVEDAFSRIIDAPVSLDLVPQYLCGWCLTLLLKCVSFRAMCVRTQQRLTEILKMMDTDGIRKCHPSQRSLHLTRTEVNIIDCGLSGNNIIHASKDVLMGDNAKDETKIEYGINLKSEKDIRKRITGTVKENVISKIVNDFHSIVQNNDSLKIVKVNKVELNEDVFMDFVLEPDSEITSDDKDNEIEINDCEIKDFLLLDNKHISTKSNKHNTKNKNYIVILRKYNGQVEINSANVNTEKDEKGNKNINMMKMEVDDNQKKNKKTRKRKTGLLVEEDPLKVGKFDEEMEKTVKGNDNEGNENKVHIKNSDTVCVSKVRKPKRVYVSPLKRLKKDFASFERANAFEVVILSKDEQLEEILLRKNLKGPFQCEDCGRGFNVQEAYTNHRARHHNPSKKHPCGICGMRYSRTSLQQIHEEAHRLKFHCKQCNYVCRNSYKAKTHHDMHKGKTFECQHCGKSFKNKTSCLSHVRKSHPENNVVCGECGETFVSDLGLQSHVKKAHAETLKSQFKCSFCSVNFNSIEALNRHKDTAGEHAGLRPCEQCGENCASETELQHHQEEKHPSETRHCEECAMTFSSTAAYETHVRRKHFGERYVSSYPRHVRRELKRRFDSRPCTSSICEQCGYKARSPSMYVYHKRTHLAVKPFACPHCPKTLATGDQLNVHIRTHTGEKPFMCAACPLAFRALANLNRHHKRIHLKQRDSFPCVKCARTFTSKYMMQLHVKTKHENMPMPKRTRKPKSTVQ